MDKDETATAVSKLWVVRVNESRADRQIEIIPFSSLGQPWRLSRGETQFLFFFFFFFVDLFLIYFWISNMS